MDLGLNNYPGSHPLPAARQNFSDTAVQVHREPISIADEEIHVWRAHLDREDAEIETLLGLLSVYEKHRADQFYYQHDRTRFIARRGVLRIILSYYLDREPHQIHYTFNDFGKPAVPLQAGDKEICFNATHSSNLALFAVTRNRAVGIDIEQVDRNFPCDDIADSFFSKVEKKQLLEVDQGGARELAFFSCWTRKEAYIKAHGKGLSIPLDQFDVFLKAGEPARVIDDRNPLGVTSRWSLHEINSAPGFIASLAVEGEKCEVVIRDY